MHLNASKWGEGGVFWLNSQASHVCPCYLHPGLGIDVLPRRLATLSLTSWNRWWPGDWRRAGQTVSMCSWEGLQVRQEPDMVTPTLTPVWTLEPQENLFIHSPLETLTPHNLDTHQKFIKISLVF